MTYEDGERDREALVDELVQAHLDTIELVLAIDGAPFAAHVAYLQGLVRYAKRTTATTGGRASA
jgi:hypothetical protein